MIATVKHNFQIYFLLFFGIFILNHSIHGGNIAVIIVDTIGIAFKFYVRYTPVFAIRFRFRYLNFVRAGIKIPRDHSL